MEKISFLLTENIDIQGKCAHKPKGAPIANSSTNNGFMINPNIDSSSNWNISIIIKWIVKKQFEKSHDLLPAHSLLHYQT